jgi:hypothetical protein
MTRPISNILSASGLAFGIVLATLPCSAGIADGPYRAESRATANGQAVATAGMHHLYVADSLAGVVYRYQINSGLPDQLPQSSLTGFQGPTQVAIDGAGFLYVGSLGDSTVRVYSPGASGNSSPVRVLMVSPAYAGGLAVDPLGYVYVSVTFAGSVLQVYAPGAHGNAVPINTLSTNNSITEALTLSPGGVVAGGVLYQESQFGIEVFEHPLSEESYDFTIAPTTFEHTFQGLAMTTSPQGDLYVRFVPQYIYGRWQDGDFAAISLSGPRRDHYVMTRDCHANQAQPAANGGIAVFDGYLYVACYSDPAPGIFIYRDDDGRRNAVRALHAPLQEAVGIAIGP